MPADRILHPRLGHSDKVTLLTDFEFRVWNQYILSSDDFGVMRCSAVTLQADNDALHARKAPIVQRALEHLVTVGLLHAFTHQARRYVYQHDWQYWQKVEWPRTTIHPMPAGEELDRCDEPTRGLFGKHPGGNSKRPPAPGILALNEKVLRSAVAVAMQSVVDGAVSVAENVRLGNSYADVVVTRSDQRLLVVEVKRHTLSPSAVSQVCGYGDLLKQQYPAHQIGMAVIGRGLAENLSADSVAQKGVAVITFDDALDCTVVGVPDGPEYIPVNFSLNPEKLTSTKRPHSLARAHPGETLTLTLTPPVLRSSEGESERKPALGCDEHFAAFTAAYPASRRQGGHLAQRAYVAAFESVGPFVLLDALEQHKRSVQWHTDRLIPSMAKWLEEKRWMQVLAETVAPQAGKQTTRLMAAVANIQRTEAAR